jgi:outer membrane protein assembly factor BamB
VKPADASEAQAKPVAVLPDAVKAVAVAQGAAPASVSGMQLKIDDASGKAVYEIDAAKPVKIMGFIPASMPVTTTVSAVDASVVSEKTPWWKAISTS